MRPWSRCIGRFHIHSDFMEYAAPIFQEVIPTHVQYEFHSLKFEVIGVSRQFFTRVPESEEVPYYDLDFDPDMGTFTFQKRSY